MPEIPTKDFDVTIRLKALSAEDAIQRAQHRDYYDLPEVVAVNPAKWGA